MSDSPVASASEPSTVRDEAPPAIAALTGIRAVAALWVVLGHYQQFMFDLLPATRILRPWLVTGFLGVDVFFVLSGFIISYNYADRMPVLERRRYGQFLYARFARIYPVHLATLLAAAGLVVATSGRPGSGSGTYDAAGFAGNLFLLQALPGVKPWNVPAWSISCEAAAYLVFPLLVTMLVRVRARRALALAVGVLAAQIVVLVSFGGMAFFDEAMGWAWVRIAGEFTVGCLLWAAWRRRARPHQLWDVAALSAVAATVVTVGLVPPGFLSYLAVPFLVVFVVATASAAGPVCRVLASRPMQWGGRVSYSLYLTHLTAVLVFAKLLGHEQLGAAPLLVRVGITLAYFLGALGVAACCYHLVEEPARTWLKRRAPRWRTAAGPAAGTRPNADPAADSSAPSR